MFRFHARICSDSTPPAKRIAQESKDSNACLVLADVNFPTPRETCTDQHQHRACPDVAKPYTEAAYSAIRHVLDSASTKPIQIPLGIMDLIEQMVQRLTGPGGRIADAPSPATGRRLGAMLRQEQPPGCPVTECSRLKSPTDSGRNHLIGPAGVAPPSQRSRPEAEEPRSLHHRPGSARSCEAMACRTTLPTAAHISTT